MTSKQFERTIDAAPGGSRGAEPPAPSARGRAVGRLLAAGAALLLCLTARTVPAETSQRAEGENVVSDLEISEASDGTALRLSSTQTPSFSVFKLRDPLRLVVDLSHSRLEAESGARRVDNGVLSRVDVVEGEENGRPRVRLIVGFKRVAHYDVRTEDEDVVIFVEGDGRERRTEDDVDLREKLEATERELASTREQLNRLRETSRSDLDEARTERERARQRVEEKRDELASARSEVERLEEQLQTANSEDREQLESTLSAKQEKVERLETSLDSRRSRVDELKARNEELTRQREQNRAELKELEERLASQKRQLEKARSRRDELREAKRQTSRELAEIETEYRERTAERSKIEDELEAARSEIEALRREKKRAVGETEKRLEDELAEKERTIARLEQTLEERRRSAEDLSERVETLERQRDEALAELETLKSERERQKERREERAERLERAENESEALDRQREALEQKLDRAREKLGETRRTVAAHESEIARLAGRVEALRAEDSGEEIRAQRIADLKEKLEAERRQVEELRAAREEQSRRIAQMESRREQMRGGGREGDREREATGGPARAVSMEEEGPNTIRDIRLVSRSGESRIVVEMDRPGEYQRLPWKESRAVMLLNNVELPDELQRTIAAEGASGAVQFVSSREESDRRVRMEAAVEGRSEERIQQEGNELIWEFAPEVTSRAPDRASRTSAPPERPSSAESETSAPPAESNYPSVVIDPAKVDRVPGMSDKELTIDLRGADVQNVLRLFAKEGGVNIIAGDEIQGTVTLQLRGVPLDQAFLIVLQSQGLGFEMRGGVIRVAPQKELRQERKARQKARKRQQETRPLEVYLMPVNYADAADMVEQVERLLSPRGSVSVDSRTNTLIIKDLPENIRSVRQLVDSLDTQVPQVLIEARIVETNDTFSQELGIQWGGDFTASQANGNPTGLAFPNVLGVSGGATDGRTPTRGTSSNPNFAVNLPAPAGTGSGGSLGLTMGSVNNSVNLNLRLSAAEESGRAKIVSAPKILTLDNEQATISQGTSIPISVVSAAGVQTVFVDATLELTVTPHVTPDGNVQLEIQASKSEPDFQNTGARGDPTILRKEAETELLIGDGETTVIGGIYTRNSGSSVTGVPFFRQIPILGWLFKKSSKSESRSELLIFITPRVVNRREALSGSSDETVPTGGSRGDGPAGSRSERASPGGSKTKPSTDE